MIQFRFIATIALLTASLSGCGMLDKKAQEAFVNAGNELGVDVDVEDVRIRIFGGSGQVTGVYIGNPEGYVAENAFEMQIIGLDMKLLSVFSKPFTLNDIVIDSPIVNLELKDPNGSNLKDIADKVSARLNERDPGDVEPDVVDEDVPKPEKEPARIAIRNLRIEGVTFNLRRADGTTSSGTLPTIELKDVGGEDGATVAGIAATIAIALAGEILEQFVEQRIASGELDPEALVSQLEQKLADFEGEIPSELRPQLEATIQELRDVIDNSGDEGYADLESIATELAAISAALVTRLAATLTDEQMAELRAFLGNIDRDALDSLRNKLTERFRQRLLLSEEQLESLKPVLQDSLQALSGLQKGIASGEINLEQFEGRYAELGVQITDRLRDVLDDSQFESLEQWIEQARQKIVEKYFAG